MRLYTAVIDCHDVHAQAHWWADALDWQVIFENEEEAAVIPRTAETDEIEDQQTFDRVGTGLVFVPVPERKTLKNRLHLDFAPHASEDRDAIIQGFLDRGATRADVGQGEDVTWTVLADPEGNEFCILSSRTR